MANSTVCQSKWKPIVEPRRAKPKIYCQAPTHWLKLYEETVIESEARTAVVQIKKIYCQAPTHWLKLYEEAIIESEARTAVVQGSGKPEK